MCPERVTDEVDVGKLQADLLQGLDHGGYLSPHYPRVGHGLEVVGTFGSLGPVHGDDVGDLG